MPNEMLCPACGLSIRSAATCPCCGRGSGSGQTEPAPGWLAVPEMRYQSQYVWLVLVSALDIMLTIVVLVGFDGHEVNPIAASVIETMGMIGAIALKFGIVVLVIVICEIIGRRDDKTGRRLAKAAILINTAPVVYTFGLLLLHG